MYMTPRAKKYRANVIDLVCADKMVGFSCGEDLKMSLLIYPPDRRKRDIDNVNKALLDALEHAGVYANDNQIKHLDSRVLFPVKGGMVKVRIEVINEYM